MENSTSKMDLLASRESIAVIGLVLIALAAMFSAISPDAVQLIGNIASGLIGYIAGGPAATK